VVVELLGVAERGAERAERAAEQAGGAAACSVGLLRVAERVAEQAERVERRVMLAWVFRVVCGDAERKVAV